MRSFRHNPSVARSIRPLVCAALLALFMVPAFLGVQIALAHALLLSANPLPDVVLARAPSSVKLQFSEDLNSQASRITVMNRAGHIVNVAGGLVPAAHPRELLTKLHHLTVGSYVVKWTSVSTDDGHVLNGSYVFSVKRRTIASAAVTPSSRGLEQASLDSFTLTSIFVHWIELTASIAWVGLITFSAFVSPSAMAPLRREELEEKEFLTTQKWVRLSAATLLLASLGMLALQAYAQASDNLRLAVSTSTLSSLFASQYGHLWIVRQGVLLLSLGATFAPRGEPSVRQRRDWRIHAGETGSTSLSAPIAPLLAVAYLYAFAASGHAASAHIGSIGGSDIFSLSVVVDWLHFLPVALWLGGQMYIVLVLIPALRPSVDWYSNARCFLSILSRFSPVAYISVAVLALSGSFNGKVHIPSWTAFFDSVYGRALTVKVVLLLLMMLISAFTVYTLRPRIRRALDIPAAAQTTIVPDLMGGLVQWLRLGPILGVGVLLATSVMFYYPVPVALSESTPVAAQGPSWKPYGLQHILVHRVVLGHGNSRLVIASASSGVYEHVAGVSWRHIFPQGEMWNVQLLSDNSTLVAADENGEVHVSHDLGQHWRDVKVSDNAVYSVTVEPHNPGRVLAGTGGGLYLSSDGGLHWERRLNLGANAGAAFAWDPKSARTVFAGITSGAPGGRPGVMISKDAGRSWQVFGHNLHSGAGIMSLFATGQREVYAGTMGRGVSKAPVQTGNWHRVAHGLPRIGDHVAGIASMPGRPGTLFAATLGYGIYRTDDGGAHWRQFSQGLPKTLDATIVLSVAYSPSLHTLFAGTGDGVYEISGLR